MFSFKQLASYEGQKRTSPNFVQLEIYSTSRSAFFFLSKLGLATAYLASLALAQNGVQASDWLPLNQQVCNSLFQIIKMQAVTVERSLP